MEKEILRMENVISEDKRLSNVYNINLHIFEKEILGLISINAIGMEMLLRLIECNDSIKFGRIYFQEQLVNNYMHSSGKKNRVYILEQKSKLIPYMKIYDNIFVMRGNLKKYYITGRKLRRQLLFFLKKYNLSLSPDAVSSDLSVFERCMVELLKAHIMGARLIIVKDLASFLSTEELVQIKAFLKELVKEKTAVLYISNIQGDVLSVCDRAAIMKDGRIVKILNKHELTKDYLKHYMKAYEKQFEKQEAYRGENNIEIRKICVPGYKDISFSMKNGECVVLYDKEHKLEYGIGDFLSGYKECSGEIYYEGLLLKRKKRKGYSLKDVSVIDIDPVKKMIFYNMNYIENLSYGLEKKLSGNKLKKRYTKNIQCEYEKYIGKEVYTENLWSLEKKSLYNIVYYRIHLLNPKIVFILQPFWGADIFDRHYIANLIQVLTKKGIAVIIITANIPDDFYVANAVYEIEENGIKSEDSPLHSEDTPL